MNGYKMGFLFLRESLCEAVEIYALIGIFYAQLIQRYYCEL